MSTYTIKSTNKKRFTYMHILYFILLCMKYGSVAERVIRKLCISIGTEKCCRNRMINDKSRGGLAYNKEKFESI